MTETEKQPKQGDSAAGDSVHLSLRSDAVMAYLERITPVGVLVDGVMQITTLSELGKFLAALRPRRDVRRTHAALAAGRGETDA